MIQPNTFVKSTQQEEQKTQFCFELTQENKENNSSNKIIKTQGKADASNNFKMPGALTQENKENELTQENKENNSSYKIIKTLGKADASNNFKMPGAGMDIWGKQRLELAAFLRDKVLPQIQAKFKIQYVIENGTLLAAWRNGKFIPHDDDFDYGLFFENFSQLNFQLILNEIKLLLPSQYDARIISRYCDKIEVFEKAYGFYILPGPQYKGADYPFVVCDLQVYEKNQETGHYKARYWVGPEIIQSSEAIFPISKIVLENEEFPAPNNIEAYLREAYGSLKQGAKYNPQTKKYHHPEDYP